MTGFLKRAETAAGETWAAVSFQPQLALLFGIGWGGALTAVFADQWALNGDFSAIACKVAAGLLLFPLIGWLGKRFSPFFALELLYVVLSGALLTVDSRSAAALILTGFSLFCGLFDGERFHGVRKKFAVGVLLGGAAAMQWELSHIPAVIWLLMTTAFCFFFTRLRFRKRTAVSGILFCLLLLWAEHRHLDVRLFARSIAGEAQGITLIAAAGTPECAGEPRALCVTANARAAALWQTWNVFSKFSVTRPGRVMPWGEKFDLIFCDRLPNADAFRIGALLKRLAPGGVLAVPVEAAVLYPQLKWQTLPGSNGSFVAARPDEPEWKIVPEKLDASLFRGKGRLSRSMLSPGALSGLLIDFQPAAAKLPHKNRTKNVLSGHWAWGILLIFLVGHFVAFRRPKVSEALSLGENCLGFALVMMLIARNLPECFNALGLLLLFFCCYPLKMRNWLLKLVGTLAIAAALCWSLAGGVVWAVIALLLTGAEFSTTLNEQMAEKPKAGRIVAVIALALGFLLAALTEHLPWAPMQIFHAALLFRVWTLIRC